MIEDNKRLEFLGESLEWEGKHLEVVSTSGSCSQKLAAFDLIVWQQCTAIMPTRVYVRTFGVSSQWIILVSSTVG